MKRILVTQTSMPPYEEYINEIKDIWDSHWLTNMGPYHKELEEKDREFNENLIYHMVEEEKQ